MPGVPDLFRQGPRRDGPVATTIMLTALTAVVLLALRRAGPGWAEAYARDVAVMTGSLGGLFVAPLVAATVVVPLFGLRSPAVAPHVMRALPLFDAICLLVMALSAVAALAALVAMGRPATPVLWFAAQTAIAWACHRLRVRATSP